MTHPAPNLLAAFRQGQLPDAQADDIATHLADCTDCQQVEETLPDDSLLALVRKVLPGESSTATLVESWVPAELVGHPRYRLLSWLGAGGMGVVYQAEHRLMERQVALKIISKKLTANPAAVERFQREVKAAAKLSHPNIVTAYDAEQAGDLHFLVMEFIDGKNLARLTEDGPLPVGLACEYVRQAALGLQHSSDQGLVHRDIKPQNLMLTAAGQVKILDFGLAAFIAEQGSGAVTEFGQGLGTPDFIAPEQIRDAQSADGRSDIYSLGCTLYCLLTGQPPFHEGSASQKIAAHLERQPKAVSEIRKDVPEAVSQMIAKMLAKEPSLRYQTPQEVAEALIRFAKVGMPPASWLNRAGLSLLGSAALLLVVMALWNPFQGSTAVPTGSNESSQVAEQNSLATEQKAPTTEPKTPTGKDEEKRLAKAIENGPGVYEVKTDDKGRITSVWVVGQARISNVLGKVKGIQDAKTKARLDALGEYTKWLKAKVDIHEKSEEETILFLEGSEGNDGKTLKESGKSVEKGSKKIEVIAQNLVRGMEVVHTDSKDGVYTVVYLWTAEKAKALEGK